MFCPLRLAILHCSQNRFFANFEVLKTTICTFRGVNLNRSIQHGAQKNRFFLFFGLLAVLGSAWLQVQVFQSAFLFPAASAGFWSMAVMNLNNIRDIASDKAAGKTTIPILIGHRKARYYQLILVAGGAVFLIVFGMLEKNPAVAGALPGFLLMVKTLPVLFTHEEPVHIDRLLKPQALGTFLAVAGMFLIAWLF